MNNLNVVITGASRGLGLAVARLLAERGANLVLVARHGDALSEAARAMGPTVTTVAADVSQSAEEIAAVVKDRLGRVDVLIHNASTVGPSPMPALADYPWQRLEEVLRVNLLAPLHLTQLLLEALPDGALVINLTSDAAVNAYPGWGGYGASKAALEHLTRTLAAEHPRLRFYLVDPGDMNTQMHQEAEPGVDLSHLPSPESVAPFFLQLITERPDQLRLEAQAVLR
ncbi:MAG: SDR family NAD(P)-dependent oxidoreductase [Vulcanimicrobiota bacterium]